MFIAFSHEQEYWKHIDEQEKACLMLDIIPALFRELKNAYWRMAPLSFLTVLLEQGKLLLEWLSGTLAAGL